MNKREREEAATVRVGGKPKGGPKPKKAKVYEQEDLFSNIDISLLNLFGFLKVSPPMEKEHLEPKITELQGKLEFFNIEGNKRL